MGYRLLKVSFDMAVRKVHVLMKKEDIHAEKIACNKVVVVLDILLATTSIVSALDNGAIQVIPVIDAEEGVRISQQIAADRFILAGELDAKPLEGFRYPNPLELNKEVKGKTLILSTTNGTIALRKSNAAGKVYISSLLNNFFVAQTTLKEDPEQTIVIVCSGNAGEVSLEDFYGAGHFVSCLLEQTSVSLKLSDAALSALSFYRGWQGDAAHALQSSKVGRLLYKHSREVLSFAADKGSVHMAPMLINGVITNTSGVELRTDRL